MAVKPTQVTWSSSNGSVLRVSAEGVANALDAGTAFVRAAVCSQTGQAGVVAEEATVANQPTTGLAGSVALPPSVNAQLVSVLAGAAGAAPVAADGSFQIQKSSAVETALLALQDGKLFGVAIAAANDSGSDWRVSINPQSTAIALVYLSPAFAVAPAGITRELLGLLGAVTEVAQLAQYLDGQVRARGMLPDTTDTRFAALYRSAVTAAEARLSEVAGVGSIRELALAPMAGPITGSGITMTPPGSITPNVSLQFQNAFGRDADLYVVPADTAGHPVISLSSLTIGTALDGRLPLGAADYVPDVTSIASWVSLLRGQYGKAAPRIVQVTFSPTSPRFQAYAYGLGTQNWSANTATIAGMENLRWEVPAVQTAVTGYVIPVIEAVSGLQLITPGTLGRFQRTFAVVDAIAKGLQWSTCIDRQPSASTTTAVTCTANLIVARLLSDRELLESLIVEFAHVAGTTLETGAAEALARHAFFLFRALSIASKIGDAVVTTYGVVNSQLRQSFELSYNDLLGASVIAKDSGDNQQGLAGETLYQNLVVYLTDSGGTAVPGAWVAWSVDAGGGSVSQTFDTTDIAGRASVRWALGPSGVQAVSAAIAGTSRLAHFSATVVPPAAPTVASVTPDNGPLTGGTNVTINGANFLNTSGATIGGNALSNLRVVNSTQIIGQVPSFV